MTFVDHWEVGLQDIVVETVAVDDVCVVELVGVVVEGVRHRVGKVCGFD